MKTCTRCGTEKHLTDFNRNRTRADGLASQCKECRAEVRAAQSEDLAAYARAWSEANPNYKAEYRAKNAAKLAEERRRWYADNPDYNREYRLSNPDVFWATTYRSRVRRMGLPEVIEDFRYADVVERYGDACFYCETGEFEHLDHAIPVSKGGPHTLDNVRPSCAACNVSKSNMTADEFREIGATA